MRITKDKARQLLKEFSLRATAPRIAVLRALASSADPLSHTEVLKHLGKTECDPATTYRSLVKLRDVGLATVVSRAEGIDRYAFTPKQNEGHSHPPLPLRRLWSSRLPSNGARRINIDEGAMG